MSKQDNTIANLLRNAGVGEETFHAMLPSMRRSNLRTLYYFSGLAVFAAIMLLAFSLLYSLGDAYRLICLGTLVAFGVILVVTRRVMKSENHLSSLLNYLFLVVVFFFGIALSCITPHVTATVFCVMLVALPLLFVDRPYRIAILLVIVTALFIGASIQFKDANVAFIDVYNSVSFCLLGIVASTIIIRSRVYELVQRQAVEIERDTDALTGLLNKQAARRAIEVELSAPRRVGSLAILDLDDFKNINDRYGHAFGDMVLSLVAKELSGAFRSTDILGRFGGDEFVAYFPSLENDELLIAKLKKVAQSVAEGVNLPPEADPVAMSIGVVYASKATGAYDELFSLADEAMYSCKGAGKHRYCIVSDERIIGELQ